MTEWRDIVGFEGAYQVSSCGAVRSLDRTVKVRGGFRPVRGQMLSQKLDRNGYVVVQLYKERRQTSRTVHSLVAEAFLGPRPFGYQVCHGDHDRTNNILTNLRYGTVLENHQEKVAAGRSARGEGVNTAKLTEALVVNMRNERASGALVDELSAKYGVSSVAVSKICNGTNWKYAPGPISPSAPRSMKK